MVAVITGGTKGIGLGIAKELLKEDFSVVLTARNESAELEELKNQYAEKVTFVSCDISNENDVENLVSFTEKNFGKIDLLVNNAGIAGQVLFTDITDDIYTTN